MLIVGSLITGWVLELFNVIGWVFIFVLVLVGGWLLILVELLLTNGFVYWGLGCCAGGKGGNTFVLVLVLVLVLVIGFVFVFAVFMALIFIFVLLPIGWSPFNGYKFVFVLVYPKLFLTTT